MGFSGFTGDALDFLADLGRNNDRAWFAENKARYERSLLDPQRELVAALGERFATIDSRVRCEPRVDGSIFRIYRDIRFSRDKSPYKTWADAALWIGVERKSTPGYFIRMVADALWVGGGIYHPTPEAMRALREAVVDEGRGEELAELLDGMRDRGWEVGSQTYKRVPRGWPADSPHADLLRYSSFHGMRIDTPPPPEFFSPELPDWMMARFLEAKPLVDWLAEEV